jgi:hypothetical protein
MTTNLVSTRPVFPNEPIRDPWKPTYLPPRELAACGHYGCPTYRCFYDGLCEHNWGDDDDCRLPIDADGYGPYCTFHGQIELARAAREYGEDNVMRR